MKDGPAWGRPRPLWVTLVCYAALLGVMVVNVWALFFWMAVGGSLGLALAGGAAGVVLALAVVLLFDGRRQWRLHRSIAGVVRR